MKDRRTKERRSAATVGAIAALAAFALLSCGPDDPRGGLSVRAGFGDDTTPFFRVIGSDLTEFRGQIGDETGSRSVDGIIPQDYVLDNARGFVTGTFTKTERGRQQIRAQVFVNGQLRGDQSTSVEGGTVTVTAPLDE